MVTTFDTCTEHPADTATDLCVECASPFCGTCLVYVRGPAKPPMCRRCALDRSGLRPGAGRPRVGWRERRRRERIHGEIRRARLDAAEARAATAPGEEPHHRPAEAFGIEGLDGHRFGSWSDPSS